MTVSRFSVGLPLLLLVTGCVAAPTATPPITPAAAPAVPSPAGLEAVMGRTASWLEAELGRPELDIREGTARKLQFVGPACILDAYLYPSRTGAEPVVTHVDARLPDGRDTDRAGCVAAFVQTRVR